MMTQRTPSPRAATAIAAVLALSSTFAAGKALAQSAPADAAPAVETAAPAASAAPAIVLPEAPAPAAPPPQMVQQPQVQAVPEAKAAAVAAEPRPARAARHTQPRIVPVARTVSPVPAPAAMASPSMTKPKPAMPAPASAPAVVRSQPVATQPASDNAWGLGLSLLAVLGLGGALVATRSRRRVADGGLAYEPAEPVAPVMAGAETPVVAEPVAIEPSPVRSSTMVAGEAADAALIEEMVAMPPDADNPFRTRKMRRRRARALLAQRAVEPEVEADEPVAPGFDWRTYAPGSVRGEVEKV